MAWHVSTTGRLCSFAGHTWESAETFLCERKSISPDPQQGEKPCSTVVLPTVPATTEWVLFDRDLSVIPDPPGEKSDECQDHPCYSRCQRGRWQQQGSLSSVAPDPALWGRWYYPYHLWLTGVPLVAPHPKLWGKWHLTGLTQHSSYSRAREDCILLSLLSHQRWGGNDEIPILLVPSAPELMPDWILL